MTRVVLAGSSVEPPYEVSVIDFTTPSSVPAATLVPSGFQASCVVDLSGPHGVLGASGVGPPEVWVRGIDLSDPAAPQLGPVVQTGLGGIGAVAAHGTIAVAGEQFAGRVVLVDLLAGALISPLVDTKLPSIASAGFCSANVVVLSGSGFTVAIVDFSQSPPAVTQIKPNVGAPVVVAADASAGLFALGDTGGEEGRLYDSSGTLTASVPHACPGGTTSIGLAGTSALYGSTNNFNDVFLVDFDAQTSTPFSPNLSVPTAYPTVNRDGNDGVCGAADVATGLAATAPVSLFNLAGGNPQQQGATQDSGLPALGSIAVSSFAPAVRWSPSELSFGVVEVGRGTSLSLAVANAGTAALRVSAVASTSSDFVAVSLLPAVMAPGQSGTIQVTFTPPQAANYSGTLTFTTNDPSHTTVTVPMTGAGAYPAVAWSPESLDFGSVDVGAGPGLSLSISNPGAVPLHVTAIQSDSLQYVVQSAALLTLLAGGIGAVQVSFQPSAATPYTGLLSLKTDDPAHPTVSVPMSGTGVPVTVSWAPTSIDFGSISQGSTSTLTVVVSNTGAADLHLTSVEAATSGSPADFSVNVQSLVVPPGQTGSLAVTFRPALLWPLGYSVTGNLLFNTDNPARPTGNIPLSGSQSPWPGCLATPAALITTAVKKIAVRVRAHRRPGN